MSESAPASAPLRVLFVAATPYFADRGCHVRIQGEARALERAGVEVTIATYGLGRDVPGGRIVRTAALPGYRRLDAAPSAGKVVLDALLLGRALAAARRIRPDLIHGHTQEGGAIGLVVGRLLGIPVLVDLQSRRVADELAEYGTSRPGGWLHRIAATFDRAIPGHAAAVVTSTTAIAEFIRAEAEPRGPVAVLGDAIDVPAERPLRDPELARALGLDPRRPIVVYLGLLLETQGIDLLLAAAARLAQRPQPIQFLIMGYPDHERWRERARALGLGGDVVLPGRIRFEESFAHVALGTLGVSPKRTLTEGNGKLLLYMAAGLPALALDTVSNREVLGPDGLYAADDTGAFAAAIAAALGDPADLARRGAALRARARAEASWDARAAQLVALYRTLIRSQSRREGAA